MYGSLPKLIRETLEVLATNAMFTRTPRTRAAHSVISRLREYLFRTAAPLLAGGIVMGVPGAVAHAQPSPNSLRSVTIMTENMDEATDFGPVIASTSLAQLMNSVTATYQEVQASKIPERAAGVAREIAATQPALVGLQEVSLWRTGPLGSRTPTASTVAFDQLQSLLDSLAQQGLHYRAVGIRAGLDVEAPSSLGFDVRVTDRDVVLARTDLSASELQVLNVQVQNFATNLSFPSPLFGSVPDPRGWVAVDAQIRGTTYRFVTTHLEAFALPVEVAQANELLHGPTNTNLPVILSGDFNSAAAGGPDSPVGYNTVIAAGFIDAWTVAQPGNNGFTWPLHPEDTFPASPGPTERIDLVLVRNGVSVLGAQEVGNTPADLTPSGLWPSDHAGVVAQLVVPHPA
jgi:endonuclease/exonuclease/phosphatase family metal-dependent hydrolase